MTVNKTFSNVLKMKSARPFVQKYFGASGHYTSQLMCSTDTIVTKHHFKANSFLYFQLHQKGSFTSVPRLSSVTTKPKWPRQKEKKVMTIWPEHGWLLWFVFFSILKIIPSHPNSQQVKVVHQVLRGYYEKRANPLGWRNHLCDLFFLPLKVSTGDKQVPLQQWQTACFRHPSPGSLQRFGIPLMCFSGETNTGSEILSSKQEPKDQIIYGFPLWVNCFHCLHLIWAAVTRRKFPSNIFFFLSKCFPLFGCQVEGRSRMPSEAEGTANASSLLFMPKWQQLSENL